MLKRCPSGIAGVYGLIRDLTIMDGTGQFVLEQLSGASVFQALRHFYDTNQSIHNKRILHEGMPSSLVIGDSVGNQYVNAGDSDPSSMFNEVECLLPLYMSGCLSPDRDTTWANMATNGLRIRINLHTAQTATTAMSAPIFDTDGNEVATASLQSHNNFPLRGGGGYSANNGYEIKADH